MPYPLLELLLQVQRSVRVTVPSVSGLIVDTEIGRRLLANVRDVQKYDQFIEPEPALEKKPDFLQVDNGRVAADGGV